MYSIPPLRVGGVVYDLQLKLYEAAGKGHDMKRFDCEVELLTEITA